MGTDKKIVWNIIEFFEYLTMLVYMTFLYLMPSLVIIYLFDAPVIGAIVFIGGIIKIMRMVTGKSSIKGVFRYFKGGEI